MRSPNWRASVSVAPPAANGTTKVTARSGYDCANAAPPVRARPNASNFFNIAFIVVFLRGPILTRVLERREVRGHVARIALGDAEVRHRARRVHLPGRAQPAHGVFRVVGQDARDDGARAESRERRADRRVGADEPRNHVAARTRVLVHGALAALGI